MWMAAGVGVVVGVFLILLLPRFLPFSADSRVASLVMGQDRISAAYAMINSVDPLGVKKLEWVLSRATGYSAEELIGYNQSLLSNKSTPAELYEEMWAMISCPFSSLTRNMVLGSVSVTVPSNSMESSFDM